MAYAGRRYSTKRTICKVCDDLIDESKVFSYECGCCACIPCLMGNLKTNRIMGRKNLDCLSCYAVRRNKEQQDRVLEFVRKASKDNEEYTHIVEKFDAFLLECIEIQDKTFCAHPPCTASFKRLDKNRTMRCEVCKKKTCHDCKLPWHLMHKNTPCERYKLWVMDNKPEWYIPSDLDDVCFTCPNCKKQFEMVRGGCLHFDCPSCGFEFCGFCRAPFHTDERNPCKLCPKGSKGMHAHHPRICPYFLRDKEVNWLWKLVEYHGHEMEDLLPLNTPKGDRCNLKYNTDDGVTTCAEKVGERCHGFCIRHFKESVSGAIFKRKTIDPIALMGPDELKTLADRERVKLESSWTAEKIRSVIVINCPLSETPKVTDFFKCPRCSTKHSIYRDGTFRFECSTCFCYFCGFCCQVYYVPPLPCNICPPNSNKGLHAHHPRICPYYLADQEVSWYTRLLENHGSTVNSLLPMNPVEGEECGFMFKTAGKKREQKCTNAVEDNCQGYCGRPWSKSKAIIRNTWRRSQVFRLLARKINDLIAAKYIDPATTALKQRHFKQLASEAIFKSKKIDPINIMTIQQLRNVLMRDSIPFEESWNQETLIEVITKQLPLVKPSKS